MKFYVSNTSIPNNLNKLFTVLGGKFKFSAQDSDFEYLIWRSKNPPVSSDLKSPLLIIKQIYEEGTFYVFNLQIVLSDNNNFDETL